MVLPDVSRDVTIGPGSVSLPFDLSAVVTNLREERYEQRADDLISRVTAADGARTLYYLLRPLLPVSLRKHLQRIRLSGWKTIRFPSWPVDCTVETLMRTALRLQLLNGRSKRIPFIWFWPDGAPSATIVTHDVEAPPGERFCRELMNIDDSFGIKSAFQVVPEKRYATSAKLVASLRNRGFEANVHDLNHDGYLFHNRRQFDERAAQINHYVREFGSRGFRAGAMHRVQDWFGSLNISFDMSVPNVAHLEPQRGGCCTVMPYFIGDIVELPLTTTQDYSLFHILNDYSTALWKEQIELILANNGLVTILTHPDYLIEQRARAVYVEILKHISQLRAARRTWVAVPGDVERWWRARRNLTLVAQGDSWRIEGPDSHRARVAYATIQDGQVRYTLKSEC